MWPPHSATRDVSSALKTLCAPPGPRLLTSLFDAAGVAQCTASQGGSLGRLRLRPPVSSGSLTARFSSDPGRSHCLGAPRFTHPLLRAPWGRLETALPGAAVCGAWSGAAWGPAHSRHVLQGAPQLAAQVLDVQPLALLHRLSREVHVVHGQLGLIEQPLHHEHRAWGHGSAGPRCGTLLPAPGSGSPRARPAARQAHRPAGCPPRGPEHLPFLEGVPR